MSSSSLSSSSSSSSDGGHDSRRSSKKRKHKKHKHKKKKNKKQKKSGLTLTELALARRTVVKLLREHPECHGDLCVLFGRLDGGSDVCISGVSDKSLRSRLKELFGQLGMEKDRKTYWCGSRTPSLLSAFEEELRVNKALQSGPQPVVSNEKEKKKTKADDDGDDDEEKEDDDDERDGPAAPGASVSAAEAAALTNLQNARAHAAKVRAEWRRRGEGTTRDSWMTELPENSANVAGMDAFRGRSFSRTNPGTLGGQSADWTAAPEQVRAEATAQAAVERAERELLLVRGLDPDELKQRDGRDGDADGSATRGKKKNTKEKSLLELHQEGLIKQKGATALEAVPSWDRERDMAVSNRSMTAKQRDEAIREAKRMSDRFLKTSK